MRKMRELPSCLMGNCWHRVVAEFRMISVKQIDGVCKEKLCKFKTRLTILCENQKPAVPRHVFLFN